MTTFICCGKKKKKIPKIKNFGKCFCSIRLFLNIGKWFEPRGISCLSCVIVWVRVVFRKTVVGDSCFDYLSASHLQSQVKSILQMIVSTLLVVLIPIHCIWISKYCSVCFIRDIQHRKLSKAWCHFNPFNPKLIMQILPTIQEENDWVM